MNLFAFAKCPGLTCGINIVKPRFLLPLKYNMANPVWLFLSQQSIVGALVTFLGECRNYIEKRKGMKC